MNKIFISYSSKNQDWVKTWLVLKLESHGVSAHVDYRKNRLRTEFELFGRQQELARLDQAWQSAVTNVISFVAFGGVGKTTLVNKWLEKMRWDNYRGSQQVFAWSFYSQGTNELVISAEVFINTALQWFGSTSTWSVGALILSPWDKGKRLANLIRQRKNLAAARWAGAAAIRPRF